jgi:hypothetical protein
MGENLYPKRPVEVMALLAEHREPEGFFIRGRRLGLEEAEKAARLLRRSDRLGEAISIFYKATEEVPEGARWAMLSALYEVKDQVDAELERFRGDIPPA